MEDIKRILLHLIIQNQMINKYTLNTWLPNSNKCKID